MTSTDYDATATTRQEGIMNTTELADAHRAFLDASTRVSSSGGAQLTPPSGEWNSDQILAHVALVVAATTATASSIAAGSNATFDNRVLLDTWSIDRAISLAGGTAGLTRRISAEGDVLCTIAGTVLSDAELDTLVACRLVSAGTLLVDEPMTLRALVSGLAQSELPRHTEQLLSLLP